MLKRILRFVLIVFTAGCVEPYEFIIKDNEPMLVIEAFVSDKSYRETLDYPSDGRYFSVKLTTTSDVINVRPRPITSADVKLQSEAGDVWQYTESIDQKGAYLLVNDDFHAEIGVNYKLSITLPDESSFESDWETLPTTPVPPMGNISFRETNIQKYVIEANEEVLKSVKGIWTNINLPENTSNEPLYYRWGYTQQWIYIAPLGSSASAGYICWATNPLLVQNYALQFDRDGGYKKDLFFMETVRNAKLYVKYSALIVQHAMALDYYNFWKEMQEQNEGGAIFDKPPYNLHTNFHSLSGDKKVAGYFGVVQEQAKRWYFDIKDLSYYVENTAKADCQIPLMDTPPECFDCRLYSFGNVTTVKPPWWDD
jgi:hypothetical protein